MPIVEGIDRNMYDLGKPIFRETKLQLDIFISDSPHVSLCDAQYEPFCTNFGYCDGCMQLESK